MNTTLNEVLAFNGAAHRYLATIKEPNKLGYAVAKMQKRLKKSIEDFNDAMDEVRLENALEEEKTKAVLLDEKGNYKMTKDGFRNVKAKQAKLFAEEVEVEPYFATSVPDDLLDAFRVAFEDFVIKPQDESV